jgi:cell division protein FtsN
VTGPFVLQGGAFRDLAKAQRRVDELRGPSGRAGLGDPRVLTKRGPDGGTLYVVQLGGFATRAQADAALARLATSGVVVARPAA